eukprot:1158477-Pelagomonas_calceolata.AAC.1
MSLYWFEFLACGKGWSPTAPKCKPMKASEQSVLDLKNAPLKYRVTGNEVVDVWIEDPMKSVVLEVRMAAPAPAPS